MNTKPIIKILNNMSKIKLAQLYLALLIMRFGKRLVPAEFEKTRKWLSKVDFK